MNALQRAMHIESHVARIIGKQELNGVQFDISRAHWYVHVLEERTLELYRKIRPHLSIVVERPYPEPVWDWCSTDTGWLSDAVEQWWIDSHDEMDEQVEGAFSRVKFVEPDIGKRQQIIEQLLRLGWKPREYTPITEKGGGGNPKITVEGEPCPSLLEIGSEIGAQLAEWYILKHRQSQIKGFLKLVRDDGRISAGAHTIGTPTYRFRHNKVVNVPKASKHVIFGRQMRSLFTVKGTTLHQRITKRGYYDTSYRESLRRVSPTMWSQDYRMVGHDASGLELRILAHYIDDESFTDSVANGDPHTANQIAAGLPTRDSAKTFIYAFIYGAGNKKIGSIVGGGIAQGREIKERFLASNPKLATLIDGVQSAGSKGWLKAIDGRRVRLRKDDKTKRPQVHKALNTLIQTGGALVMKYSMVWLDLKLQEERLDSTKVIDMHDEGQSEVHVEEASRHAWLAEESIRQAGKYLELRCPLDAESKIGTRWSETH